MATARSQETTKVLVFGATSLVLYALLYIFEEELLHHSSKGDWFFIIPVAIAFLFSFIHGSFTHHFWDALGIKAKSSRGKK